MWKMHGHIDTHTHTHAYSFIWDMSRNSTLGLILCFWTRRVCARICDTNVCVCVTVLFYDVLATFAFVLHPHKHTHIHFVHKRTAKTTTTTETTHSNISKRIPYMPFGLRAFRTNGHFPFFFFSFFFFLNHFHFHSLLVEDLMIVRKSNNHGCVLSIMP